jgi:hypothetical protein
LYQPLARSFASDLFRDTNSAVAVFETLFNAADKTPVVVAATQTLVDPATAARLTSAELQSDGRVRLYVFAPLGSTNRIESSPDLIYWTTRATVVQTNTPTWFFDGAPDNGPMRFYRLRAR